MPIDWAKTLTDRAGHPDTEQITAPDGSKVSLGEIRDAWFEREKSLVAKGAEVEMGARAIDAARNELASVHAALIQERENMAAREAAIAANPVNKTYADEYLGPHVEKIAKLEALVNEQAATLKSVKDNQFDMASRYLTKDWENAMREIGEVPEGISKEKLLKVAMDRGLKDSAGLPDIRAAFELATEPVRRAKAEKDAEERGYRRAQEESIAGKLGRPSTMRLPPAKRDGTGFSNLDSAIEAASSDPEILRLASREMGAGLN